MSDTLDIIREHAAELTPRARLKYALGQVAISEKVIAEELKAAGKRDVHFECGCMRSTLKTLRAILELK